MNLIKNSSVALTIGLVELTAAARAMQEYTFQVFEAFTAATIIYIVVNVGVVIVMRWSRSASPSRDSSVLRCRAAATDRSAMQPRLRTFDFGVIAALPVPGGGDDVHADADRDGDRRRHLLRHAARDDAPVVASRRCRSLATGYVNLMRSIPLVLVIFWFYFLVPYIGAWIIGASRPVAGRRRSVLGDHVHRCSRRRTTAEIMRAGIQSIARGQVWAGYALGLNYWQTMRQDRAAAGVPQHAADPAHPDDHPVPGHVARLRAVDHRLPRRGVEDRRSATAASSRCTCSRRSSTSSSASRFLSRQAPAAQDRDHPLTATFAGDVPQPDQTGASADADDRDPQRFQVVRQFQVLTDCTTKRRQGRGDRRLRAVGLGQVDADQGRQRAGARSRRARSGVDGIQVNDPKTNLPKLRARVGHGVPAFRAVSAPDVTREPDARADQGAGPHAGRGRRARPASYLDRVGLSRTRTSFRASSRAASSSASRSRARCRWTRSACCSTSRRPRSIPR